MNFKLNFMSRYFIALAVAVVILGGMGWWYFHQSRMLASNKIAGWELYANLDHGYSIQYPGDWKVSEVITEIDPITKTSPSGMVFADFQEKGQPKEGVTGLGEKVMVENWDTRWAIYPYSSRNPLQETDVEILVANIGKEFEDRKEERENVSVAGRTGLKVVVTSFSNPSMLEEVVIVENRDTVYVIQNLDATESNDKFNRFYESFRFEGSSRILN